MLEGEFKGGRKFECDQVVLNSVKALRYADYRLGLAFFFFSPSWIKKKKKKDLGLYLPCRVRGVKNNNLKRQTIFHLKKKEAKKPTPLGQGGGVELVRETQQVYHLM